MLVNIFVLKTFLYTSEIYYKNTCGFKIQTNQVHGSNDRRPTEVFAFKLVGIDFFGKFLKFLGSRNFHLKLCQRKFPQINYRFVRIF